MAPQYSIAETGLCNSAGVMARFSESRWDPGSANRELRIGESAAVALGAAARASEAVAPGKVEIAVEADGRFDSKPLTPSAQALLEMAEVLGKVRLSNAEALGEFPGRRRAFTQN